MYPGKTLRAYPCGIKPSPKPPMGLRTLWGRAVTGVSRIHQVALGVQGASQRSRTPGGKRRGAAPRPCLLGERHVRGVEQELLPPVGAHQSHRLLIQPHLHHTGAVTEARRGTRAGEAGLNPASALGGRRSAVALLPT